MDDARRTALLAAFDQNTEASIAATIADAAVYDDLNATEAVFAMFERTLAAGWTRTSLAMAYAQLAVRVQRGGGDPRG